MTAQEDPPTPSPLPTEQQLIEECEALILYVARHGDVIGEDPGTVSAYEKLVDAAKSRDRAELRKNYAIVTRQTYAAAGINGRSVLDTIAFGGDPDETKAWWQRCLSGLNPCNWARAFHGPRRPMAIGLIFFALALALQAAMGWAGRVNDPAAEMGESGRWLLVSYWLIRDLAPLLLAGLWGGIGSCIFLMKKLSDRLSKMAYEKSRQKGDLARIFVGAFLGIAVVELFMDDLGDAIMVGDVNLTPNLAALAAGVTTKTVYAILETVIEGIASRVSGKANKETK